MSGIHVLRVIHGDFRQGAQYDFRVLTFLYSKGWGASSEYLVNGHPKGVDICLLGNLASTQTELLRKE